MKTVKRKKTYLIHLCINVGLYIHLGFWQVAMDMLLFICIFYPLLYLYFIYLLSFTLTYLILGLNIHEVTFQQTISQYLSGPMIMR